VNEVMKLIKQARLARISVRSLRRWRPGTLITGLTVCLAVSVLLTGWLRAAPVSALPAAVTVTLSPSSASIVNCETIPVQVWVNGVTGLYGVDVRLSFDPSVLEVVDADPSKSGVQVQNGSFLSPDFVVSRDADNIAGTVQYIVTQLNPTPAVDGTGVLFTILFRAKAASNSALTFTRVDLANRSGGFITAAGVNGTVGTGAPAAPAHFSISRLGATGARLDWFAAPAAFNYHLFRDSAPYFSPTDPAYQVTINLYYDDLGAVGDPKLNHYYVVESACASGNRSLHSNRTGEFDFALVPGGS
jgi:hypothetical protein